MKEVSVGLLGCGVVGSALARLVHDEEEEIAESAGVRLRICRTLVRDLKKDRGGLNGRLALTRDLDDVLRHKRLDVLVELIGGADTAALAIRRGLAAGLSVVTANKLVLARHGEQLARLARGKGCSLAYEASVASCIPVLQSLDHALASEKFSSVVAILNGTTNFILSVMAREGLDYGSALAEAQRRGFAEADPIADVSGSDAACKLVILARKAFKASLRPRDVLTEGITRVGAEDLRFAAGFGYTIKLLAIGRLHGDRLELRVEPHLVPQDDQFATVKDETNAVLLHGESVDRLFFSGPGAGPLPTARAVLGDILSIAVEGGRRVPGRGTVNLARPKFVPPGEAAARFYLRVTFEDQPHVLAGVTRVLDACGVGVHRVEALGKGRGDIVILTHTAERGSVVRALGRLKRLHYLNEPPRAFPIYGDE